VILLAEIIPLFTFAGDDSGKQRCLCYLGISVGLMKYQSYLFVINEVAGPKQPTSALPSLRQLPRPDTGLTKFPLSISLPFSFLKLASNSDSLNKS